MESRVSTSLKRSTSETWSVCERASVRTMSSKSAAVNRARQFALIIGNSHCATEVRMASQMFLNESGTQENRSKTTVFPLLSCFPYSKNLGFVPSRFEEEMNIFLPV